MKDGVIEDVRFSGRGCVISQASASILTELIKGKTLDEVRQIGKDELLSALKIPLSPMRLKCGLLSLKVLKSAVYGINKWPDEEDEE